MGRKRRRMMESVFYAENNGIILEVHEGEEIYQISVITKSKKPTKLETKYKYSKYVQKGKEWTIECVMEHEYLQFLGLVNPLIELIKIELDLNKAVNDETDN